MFISQFLESIEGLRNLVYNGENENIRSQQKHLLDTNDPILKQILTFSNTRSTSTDNLS